MRHFKNVAYLIKTKRLNSKEKFSQRDIAGLMGYKTSQFISAIELGKCGVPLESASTFCALLDIDPDVLEAAMARDNKITFYNYVKELK